MEGNGMLRFLVALSIISLVSSMKKKIVCYYDSSSVYHVSEGKFDIRTIDPQLCTHLVYNYIGLNENGTVKILDPWNDFGNNGFNKFVGLRKFSSTTKFMVAIGGWMEESIKYSNLAGSPNLRLKFTDDVVTFLKTYDFDGLDFKWIYPNRGSSKEEDKQNYVILLQELYKRFQQEGLILSAAVGATKPLAELSYIIPELHQYVDHFNLITLDFHGFWERVTGLHSPLYSHKNDDWSVDAAVQYWLSQGAPSEKLVVGVSSYGRSFTLEDPHSTGLGSPAVGPGLAGPYIEGSGILGYNEICLYLKQNWTRNFIEEYGVPYASHYDQWVGYDDVQSVTKKAEYINSHNLGGAAFCNIDTDDFRGACGPKYPLLNALKNTLK